MKKGKKKGNSKLLLIFGVVAAVLVAIIVFLNIKKKKPGSTNTGYTPVYPSGQANNTTNSTIASNQEFQNAINKVLPPAYTNLIVDGIIGPLTKAAYYYLLENKTQLGIESYINSKLIPYAQSKGL